MSTKTLDDSHAGGRYVVIVDDEVYGPFMSETTAIAFGKSLAVGYKVRPLIAWEFM